MNVYQVLAIIAKFSNGHIAGDVLPEIAKISSMKYSVKILSCGSGKMIEGAKGVGRG